jgi:hypothetical protein
MGYVSKILNKLFKKAVKTTSAPPSNNEVSSGASYHWCRIIMEKETSRLIGNLDKSKLDTLEISGNKWESYGFNSYQTVSFPDFDICKDVLDRKYDLIIAEQVFEHLLYPYRAGKNVYNMLTEGGCFLITTPFLLKYHPEPNDCTRWTETGLRYFLEECGYTINNITTGSWGNKRCLVDNLDGWMAYNPSSHSLDNEIEYPLVVWALAIK